MGILFTMLKLDLGHAFGINRRMQKDKGNESKVIEQYDFAQEDLSSIDVLMSISMEGSLSLLNLNRGIGYVRNNGKNVYRISDGGLKKDASSGLVLQSPAHPIFSGYLTLADCTWHHFGHLNMQTF